MNYFIEALTQKYAEFDGRARRAEYWYFILFVYLAAIPLVLLDIVTGMFSPEVGIGPLGGLLILGTLIPSLAVMIRRLHDIDRSGWWALISFIPIVGPIVLIIFFVTPGTKGPNQYGPDPLAS